ncbi:hypothetical protein Tco_0185191 [Tanacetum coccineum]
MNVLSDFDVLGTEDATGLHEMELDQIELLRILGLPGNWRFIIPRLGACLRPFNAFNKSQHHGFFDVLLVQVSSPLVWFSNDLVLMVVFCQVVQRDGVDSKFACLTNQLDVDDVAAGQFVRTFTVSVQCSVVKLWTGVRSDVDHDTI